MSFKKILTTGKVFITSDTHYGQKNICRGVTNWRESNGDSPVDSRALLLAALGAAAIALIAGVFLARSLTRPLRDLTRAIQRMARGELQQQVPVRSLDELGTLTQAFNQLSADLTRSNDLRRQMTADIAHDLRTPLTVITAYIDGLREGVFKPTPDRLDAMHAEAQPLQRLVEDLRTLSLADPITARACPDTGLTVRIPADVADAVLDLGGQKLTGTSAVPGSRCTSRPCSTPGRRRR